MPMQVSTACSGGGVEGKEADSQISPVRRRKREGRPCVAVKEGES